MYFKEIETDAFAKMEHNKNLKQNAADRLKRNAEWNQKNKNKNK